MSWLKRWLAVALLSTLLSACQSPPTQIHGQTMGTTYSITLAQALSASKVALVEEGVTQKLEEINQSMSTYIRGSEIDLFNRHASTQWYSVSQSFAFVVEAAQHVSKQSNGAFDITVGGLVNIWGFGPEEGAQHTPTQKELQQNVTGYQYLELRQTPPALRKQKPNIQIDLSAIAKGYAVDELAELLEKHGIVNYLVDIGGELRVHGHNTQGKRWRIGIKDPSDPSKPIKNIFLQGAIATSGDYYNFREIDGKKITHHIDPKTGQSLAYRSKSISVIMSNAMMADAWTTALSVMGKDSAYSLAQKLGLAVYFVSIEEVQGGQAKPTELWTEAFLNYL